MLQMLHVKFQTTAANFFDINMKMIFSVSTYIHTTNIRNYFYISSISVKPLIKMYLLIVFAALETQKKTQ